MSVQSTTKSSLLDKKKYDKSKKMANLKFPHLEQVGVEDRDYGLMRSANQPSTPYPKVAEGVDADLLKSRLSMRRFIEMSKMSEFSSTLGTRFGSVTTIKTAKSPQFMERKLAISPTFGRNVVSHGTPHPNKGVVLNAKALSKRLSEVNEELKQSYPIRSQTPAKKVVRLRDATIDMVRQSSPVDDDRLSDIIQRVTQIDYSVSCSQLSVDSVRDSPSFAERRRRFDKAEFTIARFGKKMSDFTMPSTPLQHRVVGQLMDFAQKAREEFEKYIRSTGLTTQDQKSWRGQFNWLSSAASVDTICPPKQSMGDIYREIKQRRYDRSHSFVTV